MISSILLVGCVEEPTINVDKEFVKVFAELSMLHDKEKLNAKLTDSLYQRKVNEFFKTKNISQTEFRAKSELLMNDHRIWQAYLVEISKTMDSLRTVQK
jgi:hypothetical protein